MRSAELLCLPSRSEAFALVILEALAAGTPVAGYGPTLTEIRKRIGIDIGEPIFDPTPENVADGDRIGALAQLGPGRAPPRRPRPLLARRGRGELRLAPARSLS